MMNLRKTTIIFAAIALLLVGAAAYASGSSLFNQAQKYVADNCHKQNLSNETATLCYLFDAAQTQGTAINTINTTLSPIPSELINLQNRQNQTDQSIASLQADSASSFKQDKMVNVCFNVATGQLRVLQANSCYPDVRWQIPVKCFSGEPCKPDNPSDLYYLNNN